MVETPYRVPYAGQGGVAGDEEAAAVTRLLLSGRHLSSGAQRALFEQEFAGQVGVAQAVAVSSCTAALHLATHLVDLSPGDNVIASPQTYQATVSALLSRPDVEVRWCDVDPGTLNLSARRLADAIDSHTRAVFVTHYGGVPADMEAIVPIAHRCGAVVVEDCAHALGATHRGRPAGSLGDIGCFSFQSLKNISTLGQGGMLTTNSPQLAERARRIRDTDPDADFVRRPHPAVFGPYAPPTRDLNRHAKNSYSHDCERVRMGGLNFAMSEPAAAVGRIQLRRLTDLVHRRRRIAQHLDEQLQQIPAVRAQDIGRGDASGHHLYTFFVDPRRYDRETFAAAMDDLGVEIHLRYFPLHLLPEWRQRWRGLHTAPVVAERTFFSELVNLPLHPDLTDQQVEFMVDAAQRAARCAARRAA